MKKALFATLLTAVATSSTFAGDIIFNITASVTAGDIIFNIARISDIIFN